MDNVTGFSELITVACYIISSEKKISTKLFFIYYPILFNLFLSTDKNM